MIVAALGWSGLLQILAVLGGLVAVATFVAGRLDGQRVQAAAVYLLHGEWHMDMDHHDRAYTQVQIHNGSGLPIFDVVVSSRTFGSRRRLWRLCQPANWLGPLGGVKDPTDITSGLWLSSASTASMRPGETTTQIPLRAAFTRPAATEDLNLRPPVVLVFRDANGRRWVRWHDGKLSRRWPSKD